MPPSRADLGVAPGPALAPATAFDWTAPYVETSIRKGAGTEHDDQSWRFENGLGGSLAGGFGFFADVFDLNGPLGGLHGGYN